MMTELKDLLTGGYSGQAFVAAFLFATIGIVLRGLVSAVTRNPNSERTPIPFSFKFMLQDNYQRFILVWIVTYIFLRFGVAIVPMIGLDPAILDSNPAMLVAFGIGLMNDYVVKKIQNYIKEKAKEK